MIVSGKSGRETKRDWSASDLEKGVPWLKRMNAQGGDIYLRPLDAPVLLLVDELNAETVKDLHRQGLAPAVTIETSPGRFQAWVKVSNHPLSEPHRKPAFSDVSRLLPNVGKFGRLAGFTNQSVEASREGLHLYVLSHEATGTVAPAAQPYLTAIEQQLREVVNEQRRQVDAAKQRRARDRGRANSR